MRNVCQLIGALVLSITLSNCVHHVTTPQSVVHDNQTWSYKEPRPGTLFVWWADAAAQQAAMTALCNHSYVCQIQPLHVVMIERTRK